MSGAQPTWTRLARHALARTQGAPATIFAVLLCLLLTSQGSWDSRISLLHPAALASVVSAAVSAPLPPANPMSLAVTNTRDRSWDFGWAVRLNVITAAPSPILQDTLVVAADCGDCRTVGISVQFNVVKRAVGVVTSVSDATMQNVCTFGQCVTMGLVAQYTVICDSPAQILPGVKRLMWRTVALLRGMFPHQRVSVPRVLSGFNALARLFVPHAPLIRLSTPPSSRATRGPHSLPSISVALVA